MKRRNVQNPKSKLRGGANHESRTTNLAKAPAPNEPTASQAQGREWVGPGVAAPGVGVGAGGALLSELTLMMAIGVQYGASNVLEEAMNANEATIVIRSEQVGDHAAIVD